MIRRLGICLPTISIVAICLIRLLTIGAFDLIDPTETRYAFVAQEMVLSGDWLTPKLPLPTGIEAYTGKPPLHFWLTATAISIFGMNAWVTRIPSILGMIIVVACIWQVAQAELSKESKQLASVITLTAGLFFFISGSSTIDITFSAWISAAIASFAVAGQDRSPATKTLAGYAFFVTLAFAFLTKGPAAFILVGATVTLWMLNPSHWQYFPSLPWLSGGVLFLIIAAPWFILSAQKDPGFLHYFFIQENLMRFISRDYGDRFGTGHVYPRGSALWMLVVGFLPWSFVFAFICFQRRKFPLQFSQFSPWLYFALAWGLAPTLFFSLARQLHAAYLLPGFAGLAIVLAKLIEQSQQNIIRLFQILSTITTFAGLLVFLASLFFDNTPGGAALGLSLVVTQFLLDRTNRTSTLSTHLSAFTWALSIAILYAVTLISFSTHAGRIKSARFALSQVGPQLDLDNRTLTILSHNSYSFYYYPRAWGSNGQPTINTSYASLEQIMAQPPQNLMVNNSDIQRIGPKFSRQYIERGDFGKWHWWQRKL